MDGTIADLYGVADWLYYLENEMTFPYDNAKPLVNLSALARRINNLQRVGYQLAIISWTSKSGGEDYHNAIAEAKMRWLKKHLPSVSWDEIHIVPYGTPKSCFCDSFFDVLFDDEERNRNDWNGIAFDEKEMMDMLKFF
jgi:hypothetical protein